MFQVIFQEIDYFLNCDVKGGDLDNDDDDDDDGLLDAMDIDDDNDGVLDIGTIFFIIISKSDEMENYLQHFKRVGNSSVSFIMTSFS